jgi:4,5-DOPA dioxygenase extradiol
MMNRIEFILKSLGGLTAMNSIKDLKKFTDALSTAESKMPLLFVGHGSPMNGIEDNEFSASWKKLGKTLETPKAVLVISAHWLTRGTQITAMERPTTIHDFGGFPQELFDVQYPAPGHPAIANETVEMVKKTKVELDHDWGLDHGSWSVVRQMYPDANIPVLQFSIDYTKGPKYHYELAKELSGLRKKGVLILGSGNMVHNLRIMNWQTPDSGYDWAEEMNTKFKQLILDNNHQPLINYEALGQAARLAIPTPEHYIPLLYTLGLKEEKESLQIFNDKTMMGSISMTSLLIGANA